MNKEVFINFFQMRGLCQNSIPFNIILFDKEKNKLLIGINIDFIEAVHTYPIYVGSK